MRRAMFPAVLAFSTVLLGLAGCQVDSHPSGCERPSDCLYGRVCWEGSCVFPETLPPDAFDEPEVDLDQGEDLAVDPVEDSRPDTPPDPGPDQPPDPPRDPPPDRDLPPDGTPERDVPPDRDLPPDQPPDWVPDLVDVQPDGVIPEVCVSIEELDYSYAMDVGDTMTLQACVSNCGNDSVMVHSIAVSTDSSEVALAGVLEPPLTPVELEEGNCLPVTITIQALSAGWTNLVVEVDYYHLSMSRVFTTRWGSTIQVQGDCPTATIWAQPDRGLEGGSAYLNLDVGHQIAITLGGDESYWMDNIAFETTPEGSLELIQTDSRDAVFVPDSIGHYVIGIQLTDGMGCNFNHDLVVDVNLPLAEFVAWVVWPERVGAERVSDLDFYAARQTDDGYYWQTSGLVVGPNFSTANFGDPDTGDDDPTHHFDYNTQGFGPELITILHPSSDEQVAIGVFAFSTETRWRPARPRIQVYLGYQKVLDRQLQLYQSHFWIAAETLGTDLVDDYEIIVQGFPPSDLP